MLDKIIVFFKDKSISLEDIKESYEYFCLNQLNLVRVFRKQKIWKIKGFIKSWRYQNLIFYMIRNENQELLIQQRKLLQMDTEVRSFYTSDVSNHFERKCWFFLLTDDAFACKMGT